MAKRRRSFGVGVRRQSGCTCHHLGDKSLTAIFFTNIQVYTLDRYTRRVAPSVFATAVIYPRSTCFQRGKRHIISDMCIQYNWPNVSSRTRMGKANEGQEDTIQFSYSLHTISDKQLAWKVS